MRVIFLGTAQFAVPSLERLVEARHTVVMCVTQPERPQGRGRVLQPSPVRRTAERLALPLMQPERIQRSLLAPLASDVGVVAAYGQLIDAETLALPAHGVLGVHPSLLPRYRGAAPVARALLDGEITTGVTIYRLNAQMDAGEILAQERVAIAPDETAPELTDRLAGVGAELLVRSLADLAAGRATFTAQDESLATVAAKLTKTQGQIDWAVSAERIVRLVRACVPWPGAMTTWHGTAVKLWAVSLADAPFQGVAPGIVLQANAEGMVVAAGQGAVRIVELQPAGRRRMSVQEFLAGHQLRPGDRLGNT